MSKRPADDAGAADDAEDAEMPMYDDSLDKELFRAAGLGAVADVQALLQGGADCVFIDDQGSTTLHAAAAGGHAAIVQLLLQAGHPYNLLDGSGKTAAEAARSNGHAAIWDLLLGEGIRTELLLNLVERRTETEQGQQEQEFLSKKLVYSEGKLVDEEGNGVMMGWEAPLMLLHADAIAPTEGLDILNLGFGLGIIDEAIQARRPRRHVIVEAHPDVQKHMLAMGWADRPGVTLLFGRWQDVLPLHAGPGKLQFDGVFSDTFGEDYKELARFHRTLLPGLLTPGGVYSFFNGLAATNPFFHAMYLRIAAADLEDAGLSTAYTAVAMDASGADWAGVVRKYWTLDTYHLPVCRLAKG